MTGRVKYAVSGDVAMLVLPFKRTSVRCFVDSATLPLIRSSFLSLSIFDAKGGLLYVQGQTRQAGLVLLHRYLLGLGPKDSRQTDHINGNTLDCRRKNLRTVSASVNCLNRSLRTDNASGVRGVSPSNGKWLAQVQPMGHVHMRRTFDDIRDAAEAVWLALLEVDPVSAQRYLHDLPDAPPAENNPVFSDAVQVASGPEVLV